MYMQSYLLVEIQEINCTQSRISYEILHTSMKLILKKMALYNILFQHSTGKVDIHKTSTASLKKGLKLLISFIVGNTTSPPFQNESFSCLTITVSEVHYYSTL